MKKLVIFVLVFFGIISASTFFISSSFDERIERNIAKINEAQGFYEFSWNEYQKGWFYRKGELGLKIKIPSYINYSQKFGDTLKFKLDISIQHGPLLFQNGLDLGLFSWRSELITNNRLKNLIEWNENRPLLYSTGKMSIFGSIYNKDTLSPFDILIPEVNDFTFSGFTAITKSHKDKISGKLVSQGFELFEGRDKISLNDLDFSFIYENISYNDFLNNDIPLEFSSKFNIGSVEIEFESYINESISLDNASFELSSKVSDDKEKIDIDSKYEIDSFNYNNYEVKNILLDMTFANYSIEFLKIYNNMIDRLIKENQPELWMQDELLTLLPTFLSSDPALKLNSLTFSSPEGIFDSKAKIQLMGINQLPAYTADKEFWLEHLSFSISASADKELTEKIVTTGNDIQGLSMLDFYVQQGFLKKEEVNNNEKYAFEYILENGEFLLNGKVFDINNGFNFVY